MKLTLSQQLTQFSHILQTKLFPLLEESIGEMDATARQLVATLEMIPLQRFIPVSGGWMGRPSKDRYAIACAFVAKALYGFTCTRQLLERLSNDKQLRRICGWNSARLPHEATFSRAFEEFARMELPQLVHETLIRETQRDRLIGHISRDSTAIEVRERFPETKAQAQQKALQKAPRKKTVKKGMRRPAKRYKGGKRPIQPNEHARLHRQRNMSLPAMLAELPKVCAIGVKTSSKGNQQYWRGYKLHLDVADGELPISAVLTSASLHDSQAAIPLAAMSSERVTYCYELMDSAYDAQEILDHSRGMGHVPIVDPANRNRKRKSVLVPAKPQRQMSWAEKDRYRERTTVERVNARMKDEFGARFVRVRGAAKVMAHLMFGVLALTVDQLLSLQPRPT